MDAVERSRINIVSWDEHHEDQDFCARNAHPNSSVVRFP
jgi:hypothetical protein